MTDERWKPNVTVATVIEKKGQYLLVYELPQGVSKGLSPAIVEGPAEKLPEESKSKGVYNQPAGHLDEGESLVAAAERETLEETAWEVSVSHYLGMYRYIAPNGITYMRHGFVAQPIKHHPERMLDEGIIDAVWMSYEDICNNTDQMRSPMVKQLIDDYQSGQLYSLAVIHEDR